jgi:hypothetical protein
MSEQACFGFESKVLGQKMSLNIAGTATYGNLLLRGFEKTTAFKLISPPKVARNAQT